MGRKMLCFHSGLFLPLLAISFPDFCWKSDNKSGFNKVNVGILNKMKNAASFLLKFFFVMFSMILSLITVGCDSYKDLNYTVGVVNPNPRLEGVVNGFMNGMESFGYHEGKNITYIYKKPISVSQVSSYAEELLAKNVDLIFSITTPATLAVKKMTATTNVPVVFDVYAAVESGVVMDFIRHESNLTGIQIKGSTLKSLEYLLAIAPDAKRIFVPIVYDTPAAMQNLAELQKGAEKFKVELVVKEVKTVQELSFVLDTQLRKVDAVFVLTSILLVSNMDVIMEAAIKYHLPVGAGTEQYVKGAQVTYAHNHYRAGQQISRLADRILQSTSPASLPVEQCDFYLGVNLETAGKADIQIPEHILQYADKL